RLARADRRAAARSGAGSLREPRSRLPACHAAALAAGRVRGHAPHVHPGRRRLHQRAAPRDAAAVHDRQRHPVEVPRADGLPGCGGALVRADGPDRVARPGVRARARDGEAHGMTAAVAAVRRHVLTAYSLLAFAYLLVPIAVVVMFSFNAPRGRFNYV